MRQLCYFTTLPLACQELFKFFSSFISTFILSTAFQVYHNFLSLSRTFFFLFWKERRRRDLNPRAAINDLLPFQGSPFGQLGYFSKCPKSVTLFRCNSLHTFVFFIKLLRRFLIEKPCALYRTSKQFVKCFFKFFQNFFINLTSGESGIRTHAPLRTNGFQDRLVMTTSISLRIFDAFLCQRK